MRKKMKRKVIIAVTIITVLCVHPAYCSWVDDWIAQKTVSNAGTFESQKRGFATAGGANMRWRQSNDYLVTASPPKFTRGCGGIDMFLGGFGFLKFEMLVEKLQRIMGPSAAAFAFDIAMNTLCEPCSKGIKSLEAITDRLNQLQLDDCKAQKAIVATLKSGTGVGGPAETEAVSDFLQSSGAQDLWKDIVDSGNGRTTTSVINSNGVTKQDMVSGCPTEIRNIFFTSGSLLDNLAQEKGVATAYIDLIRALVGDIEISPGLEFNYLQPCEENNPEKISDFMYGDIFVRDLTTNNCNPITAITVNGSSYSSLAAYIRFELEGIAQSMLNKTALTPQQELFIETVPGPIYMAIKNDIQALGESATAANIAGNYVDFASSAYAVAIFNDLYTTIESVLATADYLVKNKTGTDTGVDQNTCQTKLKDGPYSTLLEMQKKIARYKVAIGENYNKKVQVFLANIQMGANLYVSQKDIKRRKTEQLKREIK